MKCMKTLALVAVAAICTSVIAMQKDDPAKKLGVLVGKWETEGKFTGTENKSSSTLECRWSPMGKLASDLCVCAPHKRSAGTATLPRVSCSIRVSPIPHPPVPVSDFHMVLRRLARTGGLRQLCADRRQDEVRPIQAIAQAIATKGL